jgi:hypothetical protein
MFKESLRSFFTSIPPSWRFAVTAFVILRGFYAVWSFVILAIYPLVVQNFETNNLPVVLTFNMHTSQGAIYLRDVDGQALIFRPIDADFMSDTQTGSAWDVKTGESVNGAYKGKSLADKSEMLEDVHPYYGIKAYPISWLAIWQRYDANWYMSIAEHGYGKVPGDFHFPPLFPVLIRTVSLLTGNSFIAGLLISHLAALLTIKLLYDLFHEWMPAALAKRAIVYFLVFPTSFFLFSVYSESIFLVFVLVSMQMMKRKSWVWAGIWIFCAILTRLQAVALFPALLYLIYKDKPFLKKPAHWVSLIFPALAGFVFLLLRRQGGESNVVPTVELVWGTHLATPWESYGYALHTIASGQAFFRDFLNLFIATLFIFMLVIGWRKLPIEYSLYTAGSILIMLSRIVEGQPLSGMTRFALSLFPMFILLGLIGEKPILNRLILYPAILLNIFLCTQFWMWVWVA